MSKKIVLYNSEEGYDLAAQNYDKKKAYLDSFEKDVLFDVLGDVSGKKILDVGAGTGRVSIELAKRGAHVVALDVSEKMLEKIKDSRLRLTTDGQARLKIKKIVGDAESLPFEDESFDGVVAAFLIVHLKDPQRFFDEVYRVLKPGGFFVVTNINQKRPPEVETKQGKIIIESYYHRPEKIRELLEGLAFGIEEEKFVKEGEVWINQIIRCRK
ncbi:MAG: class I SAM-dependent methyltransferase [Candidatus Magasanikbacteria bacterium]